MPRAGTRLATAVLLLASIFLGVPAAGAAGGATAELTIATHTPTVLTGGDTLRLTGTLRNTGSTPLPKGVILLQRASARVAASGDVTSWLAASTDSGAVRSELARTAYGVVAPGASVPFTLTVPRAARYGAAAYGVLPLAVRAGDSEVRTFAAYERVKEYEPLDLTVLLPVTMPADPNLYAGDPAVRLAAWRDLAAPTSTVRRMLAGSTGQNASWILDPSLLDIPQTIPDSPTGSAPAGTASAPLALSEEELRVRTDLAEALASAATTHTGRLFPDVDLDLAAAISVPEAGGATKAAVERSNARAAELGLSTDVVWPAEGIASEARLNALNRAYALPGGPAPALVVSSAVLAGTRIDAAQRARSGVPLLVAEAGATQALAAAAGAQAGPVEVQALIAETFVALNQSPGIRRPLLLAPARGLDADPARLAGALTALRAVPWLAPSDLGTLVGAARRSSIRAVAASGAVRSTPTSITDSSPLTSAAVADLSAWLRLVRALASVRTDSATAIPRWEEVVRQALSTRWRGAPEAWKDLVTPLQSEAKAAGTSLKLTLRDVTLLADSGRILVVVENTLPVAVDNLTVRLDSDNPLLRLSRPQVSGIRIGALSKTVIPFEAVALAAGEVTLTARLTGPSGDELAGAVQSNVGVSPTGAWIYWVIGGIAALALVLGIRRTLRTPNTRPIVTGVP